MKKKMCAKALPKEAKSESAKKVKTCLKTNNQKVKKKRGRKLSEPIIGFTAKRREVLRVLIELYEQGTMNQCFGTGMANLARYIASTELLKYCDGDEYRPLKVSSLTVLLSNVWTDMKDEREMEEKKQRMAKGFSLIR